MEARRGPKLGSNTGPKLGPNSGTKMGSNTGPKMGCNTGPKMESSQRLGIGAQAVGPGKPGTQKLSNPCNWFRNTENGEGVSNKSNILNTERVLNTEECLAFDFKSTDDILKLLQTHPDFERAPPDHLKPIIAAILSGALTLFIFGHIF